MRWGRKLFLPWTSKDIIKKVVRRSSQLASSRFHTEKGRRVVFEVVHYPTFRDEYTSPSRYVFGGMPSSW